MVLWGLYCRSCGSCLLCNKSCARQSSYIKSLSIILLATPTFPQIYWLTYVNTQHVPVTSFSLFDLHNDAQ